MYVQQGCNLISDGYIFGQDQTFRLIPGIVCR